MVGSSYGVRQVRTMWNQPYVGTSVNMAEKSENTYTDALGSRSPYLVGSLVQSATKTTSWKLLDGSDTLNYMHDN